MQHKSILQRAVSILLAASMTASIILQNWMFPTVAYAADKIGSGDKATSNVVERYADPTTAMTFKTALITDETGTLNAGRLWVDKSVFALGDTSNQMEDGVTWDGSALTISDTQRTDGTPIQINARNDFLTVFSALGSTSGLQQYPPTPIDLVLTIDVSSSMGSGDDASSRISQTIKAADELITELMELSPYNRIGIVLFDDNPYVLVPLDHYEPANGSYLPDDASTHGNGFVDENHGYGVKNTGDPWGPSVPLALMKMKKQ